MPSPPASIAIIGFGEVGQLLARNFLDAGVKEVATWDIAFKDPASAQARAAKAPGIRAGASPADALSGQGVVISAVTAGSAEAAAHSAAGAIEPGAFYADVNSTSPGTKQHVAAIVERTGARFVEVTIMSPIAPRGIRSPMLLGGVHAQDFIAAMSAFAPDMTAVSDTIGKAAATKMCRSVMIKGMEALFIESMAGARKYGVEAEVLASLADWVPHDWTDEARYMIHRALIHGRRRAEEMREAAKTVAEAGLEPLLTAQTAARQDWAAAQEAAAHGLAPSEATLDELLTFLTRKR